MARMLILADDLTGAADCAVACAAYGLRTIVALDDCAKCNADVLAIDANTRAAEPDRAAAVMARLVDEHVRDDMLVYKKIDSTLRGNVAAELAAALRARRALAGASQDIVALLAPAFPANGRTTVDCRLLVRGVPLAETDLWQYERKRPPSNLLEIMTEAGLRSTLVGLTAIREGDLCETMRKLACETDALLCDAETDEDLCAIANASMALDRRMIWAGSAGLAYHLPRAAGLRSELAAPTRLALMGPALYVVGSGSSVSRRQAQVLEAWPDVISVRIAPGVLLAGEELPEWRGHRAALERAFNAGVDVLVTVGAEGQVVSAQEPLLAAALGELVRPFAGAVGALVATGGETARAVFRAWGISQLQILGEVEPGLPYSAAIGWDRQLPVLTKAGGFGGPETLLRCREFLKSLGHGDAGHLPLNRGHNS
jgi:D-threonate/D-erythronate kinase